MSSPPGPPGLGIYHTPLNPREALALSPLKAYSMSMRSGVRPGPPFMRAASSTANSVPRTPAPNARLHPIRSATWQNMTGAAGHGSLEYSRACSHLNMQLLERGRIPDHHYVEAGKLWSQDHGGRSTPPARYPSPISPPTLPLTPPSRAVELEGSPTMMPAAQFGPRQALQSIPKRAQPVRHNVQESPIRLRNPDSMIIRRKPVGSGLSPKNPSVGSARISPYDVVGDMAAHQDVTITTRADGDEINGNKRISAAWETFPDAFTPNDLLSPCDPNARRAKGSPQRTVEKKSRPKPCVRFAGRSDSHSSILSAVGGTINRGGERTVGAGHDTSPGRKARHRQVIAPKNHSNDGDIIHLPDPSLDLTLNIQSLTNLATTTWDHFDTHIILNYYSDQQFKEYALYTLKFILLLYLASSLWNILSGIKDGLVRALQPVIMLWSFVRWMVAAGR